MLSANRSPWIHQLNRDRETVRLNQNIDTDVVIVGAGISGVATAFFALENTDKKIVLVDGDRLAHGATGHNAGQITSYFERPLSSIRDEFGNDKAKHAQQAVESAWELLDQMYRTAELNIPVSSFIGHAGITEFDRVIRHLEDNLTREQIGLKPDDFFVADNAPFLSKIPDHFKDFYRVVPQEIILEKLETLDDRFFACLSSKKGCLNSALFCQEIVMYLLGKYPHRFFLFEHTHINKIILKVNSALLDAITCEITATKVILCTNGFERITIINNSGLDLNTRFHRNVSGIVGFMSGFLINLDKPPTAISYISNGFSKIDGDYYYVTRRHFEDDKKQNLISVGGPEILLDDTTLYQNDRDYPAEAEMGIDSFVHSVLQYDKVEEINYEFKWHGLMGYTSDGIRIIGTEPINDSLLYNLGCNGIGILPSIYGGKRISQILNGEKLTPSIFDPKNPDKK